MTTVGYGDVLQIGPELHRSRRFRGLTQQQLAGLSTVSVRAIRDLELGHVRHPRRDTLRLLADALRLSGPRRAALELSLAGDPMDGALSALTEADGVPVAAGPLVGRHQELARLVGLLESDCERLVSVVGLAGVGKTRLALAAAHAVRDRDDRTVLWVPSGDEARCTGPFPGTPRTVFADWVHQLISGGDALDALTTLIGDRGTLLVLDGYDLPADLRARLAGALAACPRLRVLCVGRECAALPERQVLALAPLPDPVADQAAVRLLMAEAERDGPRPDDASMPVLAEVCRALDGLPLAVQGAASWLSLYTPRQLLDIAADSPLALTESAADEDAGDGATAGGALRTALVSSVARLGAHHARLLRAVAPLEEPWGADRAARLLDSGPIEAGRAVRALLQRGLIRQVADGGAHVRFRVLNLIRHVVREVAPEPLAAVGG